MRRLKLGIIGFGRIVELTHLPVLKKLPDFEVTGIFDITPQRIELAERRGYPVFSRLDDLLQSDAEIMLIATPPSRHFEAAAASLRHGKHVMIEKPITQTAEEALCLKEIAQRTGKKITVFHNRRFDMDYLFVKKAIAEGWLGEILFVERGFQSFGSGSSFGVKAFYPDWRNEIGFGGGALLDWGVHLADQLLQLQLGRWHSLDASLYSFNSAKGDAENYVYANIKLVNGIRLMMNINFASHANLPLWVVGGKEATLQVSSEMEAKIYVNGKAIRSINTDESSSVQLRRNDDGVKQIYLSMADCLLRNKQLTVSLEQAIETMHVLDAIRKSADERGEIINGSAIFSTAN